MSNAHPSTVLTTASLRFRYLNAGDLVNLYRLYRDVRVMRYITGRPRTFDETSARLSRTLQHYEEYGIGLYAVEDLRTGHFIGRCGLEPLKEDKGLSGELAWMFHPDVWGRGYGTESGQALLALGQQNISIHRIVATADHRNASSIAIMKRIGLTWVVSDDRGVEYEWRR
ncbi:MAG: GNAT family N-acetyltransferase [Pseudomonadota bacterium]